MSNVMALIKNCFVGKNTLFSVTKQLFIKSERRNIARWVAPTLRELQRRKDKEEFFKTQPDPESPRSSYLEWNYEAELSAVGPRLGETDLTTNLLRRALTHSSYKHTNENINEDNRELINNGDKFIKKWLTQCLIAKLPNLSEETRNHLIEHVTQTKLLAEFAKYLGFKDLIRSAEYPPSDSTLSNTTHALIGALLECTSEKNTENFLSDLLLPALTTQEIMKVCEQDNSMDKLRTTLGYQPEPRLCNSSAPGTILAAYRVALYGPQPERTMLGAGWGEDIQTATDVAAKDALARLQRVTFNMPQMR